MQRLLHRFITIFVCSTLVVQPSTGFSGTANNKLAAQSIMREGEKDLANEALSGYVYGPLATNLYEAAKALASEGLPITPENLLAKFQEQLLKTIDPEAQFRIRKPPLSPAYGASYIVRLGADMNVPINISMDPKDVKIRFVEQTWYLKPFRNPKIGYLSMHVMVGDVPLVFLYCDKNDVLDLQPEEKAELRKLEKCCLVRAEEVVDQDEQVMMTVYRLDPKFRDRDLEDVLEVIGLPPEVAAQEVARYQTRSEIAFKGISSLLVFIVGGCHGSGGTPAVPVPPGVQMPQPPATTGLVSVSISAFGTRFDNGASVGDQQVRPLIDESVDAHQQHSISFQSLSGSPETTPTTRGILVPVANFTGASDINPQSAKVAVSNDVKVISMVLPALSDNGSLGSYSVAVFEEGEGGRVLRTFQEPLSYKEVADVEVTPSGSHVIVALFRGTLKIYNVQTGEVQDVDFGGRLTDLGIQTRGISLDASGGRIRINIRGNLDDAPIVPGGPEIVAQTDLTDLLPGHEQTPQVSLGEPKKVFDLGNGKAVKVFEIPDAPAYLRVQVLEGDRVVSEADVIPGAPTNARDMSVDSARTALTIKIDGQTRQLSLVEIPPIILPQPITVPGVGSVDFTATPTGAVNAIIKDNQGNPVGNPIPVPAGSTVVASETDLGIFQDREGDLYSLASGSRRHIRFTGEAMISANGQRTVRVAEVEGGPITTVLLFTDSLAQGVGMGEIPDFLRFSGLYGGESWISQDGKFYVRPYRVQDGKVVLRVFNIQTGKFHTDIALGQPPSAIWGVEVDFQNHVLITGLTQSGQKFNLVSGDALDVPNSARTVSVTYPPINFIRSTVVMPLPVSGRFIVIADWTGGGHVTDFTIEAFGDGRLSAEPVLGRPNVIRVRSGSESRLIDLATQKIIEELPPEVSVLPVGSVVIPGYPNFAAVIEGNDLRLLDAQTGREIARYSGGVLAGTRLELRTIDQIQNVFVVYDESPTFQITEPIWRYFPDQLETIMPVSAPDSTVSTQTFRTQGFNLGGTSAYRTYRYGDHLLRISTVVARYGSYSSSVHTPDYGNEGILIEAVDRQGQIVSSRYIRSNRFVQSINALTSVFFSRVRLVEISRNGELVIADEIYRNRAYTDSQERRYALHTLLGVGQPRQPIGTLPLPAPVNWSNGVIRFEEGSEEGRIRVIVEDRRGNATRPAIEIAAGLEIGFGTDFLGVFDGNLVKLYGLANPLVAEPNIAGSFSAPQRSPDGRRDVQIGLISAANTFVTVRNSADGKIERIIRLQHRADTPRLFTADSRYVVFPASVFPIQSDGLWREVIYAVSLDGTGLVEISLPGRTSSRPLSVELVGNTVVVRGVGLDRAHAYDLSHGGAEVAVPGVVIAPVTGPASIPIEDFGVITFTRDAATGLIRATPSSSQYTVRPQGPPILLHEGSAVKVVTGHYQSSGGGRIHLTYVGLEVLDPVDRKFRTIDLPYILPNPEGRSRELTMPATSAVSANGQREVYVVQGPSTNVYAEVVIAKPISADGNSIRLIERMVGIRDFVVSPQKALISSDGKYYAVPGQMNQRDSSVDGSGLMVVDLMPSGYGYTYWRFSSEETDLSKITIRFTGNIVVVDIPGRDSKAYDLAARREVPVPAVPAPIPAEAVVPAKAAPIVTPVAPAGTLPSGSNVELPSPKLSVKPVSNAMSFAVEAESFRKQLPEGVYDTYLKSIQGGLRTSASVLTDGKHVSRKERFQRYHMPNLRRHLLGLMPFHHTLAQIRKLYKDGVLAQDEAMSVVLMMHFLAIQQGSIEAMKSALIGYYASSDKEPIGITLPREFIIQLLAGNPNLWEQNLKDFVKNGILSQEEADAIRANPYRKPVVEWQARYILASQKPKLDAEWEKSRAAEEQRQLQKILFGIQEDLKVYGFESGLESAPATGPSTGEGAIDPVGKSSRPLPRSSRLSNGLLFLGGLAATGAYLAAPPAVVASTAPNMTELAPAGPGKLGLVAPVSGLPPVLLAQGKTTTIPGSKYKAVLGENSLDIFDGETLLASQKLEDVQGKILGSINGLVVSDHQGRPRLYLETQRSETMYFGGRHAVESQKFYYTPIENLFEELRGLKGPIADAVKSQKMEAPGGKYVAEISDGILRILDRDTGDLLARKTLADIFRHAHWKGWHLGDLSIVDSGGTSIIAINVWHEVPPHGKEVGTTTTDYLPFSNIKFEMTRKGRAAGSKLGPTLPFISKAPPYPGRMRILPGQTMLYGDDPFQIPGSQYMVWLENGKLELLDEDENVVGTFALPAGDDIYYHLYLSDHEGRPHMYVEHRKVGPSMGGGRLGMYVHSDEVYYIPIEKIFPQALSELRIQPYRMKVPGTGYEVVLEGSRLKLLDAETQKEMASKEVSEIDPGWQASALAEADGGDYWENYIILTLRKNGPEPGTSYLRKMTLDEVFPVVPRVFSIKRSALPVERPALPGAGMPGGLLGVAAQGAMPAGMAPGAGKPVAMIGKFDLYVEGPDRNIVAYERGGSREGRKIGVRGQPINLGGVEVQTSLPFTVNINGKDIPGYAMVGHYVLGEDQAGSELEDKYALYVFALNEAGDEVIYVDDENLGAHDVVKLEGGLLMHHHEGAEGQPTSHDLSKLVSDKWAELGAKAERPAVSTPRVSKVAVVPKGLPTVAPVSPKAPRPKPTPIPAPSPVAPSPSLKTPEVLEREAAAEAAAVRVAEKQRLRQVLERMRRDLRALPSPSPSPAPTPSPAAKELRREANASFDRFKKLHGLFVDALESDVPEIEIAENILKRMEGLFKQQQDLLKKGESGLNKKDIRMIDSMIKGMKLELDKLRQTPSPALAPGRMRRGALPVGTDLIGADLEVLVAVNNAL